MDFPVFMRHMMRDKKVLAGKLRLILPTNIGQADLFSDVSETVQRSLKRIAGCDSATTTVFTQPDATSAAVASSTGDLFSFHFFIRCSRQWAYITVRATALDVRVILAGCLSELSFGTDLEPIARVADFATGADVGV